MAEQDHTSTPPEPVSGDRPNAQQDGDTQHHGAPESDGRPSHHAPHYPHAGAYPQHNPYPAQAGYYPPQSPPYDPNGYHPPYDAASGYHAPPPGYGAPHVHAGYAPYPPSPDAMTPNVAAGVSYFAGTLIGLVVYITHKHPEARFHAMQAMILNVALGAVIGPIIMIISVASSFGRSYEGFVFGSWFFLFFLHFGIWVYTVVQGFRGVHFELPLIGKWAASVSAHPR